MFIDWNESPDWAGCVISAESDGDRLYWAEPWGTVDGKRQEIGYSRQPYDIADTSVKNGWSLVQVRPLTTEALIKNGWLNSPSLHIQQVGRIYRLPPIGSTVRIDKGDRVVWDAAEMFIGVDVTLVSTFMTGDTQMVVVEHPTEKQCCCFRADMVRIPEQIAPTERESAIKAFMRIGDIYYCDAEKLYDAGARLPQASKGDQ